MIGPARGSADAALRRARICVAAVFALNGFLAAMWVAHIPVITERTGVSYDELGGILLLLGGCAFVGMQVCGPLIDRWSPRSLTIGAAVLLSAVIIAPVLATDAVQLACALGAFGFANGCLDVSMNAAAVSVEREFRRPIMSAFHGFFSVGSLVGSGIVAATLWAGIDAAATVGCAAVGGVVIAGLVSRGLPGRPPQTDASMTLSGRPVVASGRRWWDGMNLRRLALLAAVAFALMLAEGTAYDWSALHVVETFGTTGAIGAIAFAAYSAAMTISRFLADRVVSVVGAVAVVRYGAAIGVVGMMVAILAPVSALAIVGWAVFGVGLAALIPQIFTAAGNLTDGSGGRTISTVVGCGYLGMLAGPAVVGFISSRSTLGTGLLAAVAALVFAILVAGVVAPPTDDDRPGRDRRGRAGRRPRGSAAPDDHATLEG